MTLLEHTTSLYNYRRINHYHQSVSQSVSQSINQSINQYSVFAYRTRRRISSNSSRRRCLDRLPSRRSTPSTETAHELRCVSGLLQSSYPHSSQLVSVTYCPDLGNSPSNEATAPTSTRPRAVTETSNTLGAVQSDQVWYRRHRCPLQSGSAGFRRPEVVHRCYVLLLCSFKNNAADWIDWIACVDANCAYSSASTRHRADDDVSRRLVGRRRNAIGQLHVSTTVRRPERERRRLWRRRSHFRSSVLGIAFCRLRGDVEWDVGVSGVCRDQVDQEWSKVADRWFFKVMFYPIHASMYV